MTSREYWRKRAIEREAFFSEHVGADLSLEIKQLYEKALPEIEKNIAALYGKFAGDNGLTMAEARRLIRGKEFRQWRMSLLEYVKAAKFDSKILKELNTLAMRKRISRLEMLHAQTLQEIATLADKVDHKVESIFTRAYLDARYENLYDIQREVGLKTPPVAVDSSQVRQALLTPWSGKNYSQRIWRNAEKLATAIKETVVQAIHQGTSVQKLSKNLARRMEVGYSNAERLVRTELNYVMNRAAGDALRSADMEYYMFIATLDHRTTPRCRSLDGQVFPVEEMMQGENAPPMHVRCRSTIAASLGESLGRGTRVARNKGGRNIRVPADMNYADWKKVYIDRSLSLKDWQNQRERGKMRSGDKPHWPPKNKDNVISKEEYRNLREFAESNGIALSNVKKFDGSPQVMRDAIQTLAKLKANFPTLANEKHRLTLGLTNSLDAEDFAITHGRIIELNENAYRDVNLLQSEYQKAVSEGWFVKGTDYHAIIYHEFGHTVADVYGIDSLKIACEVTGLRARETVTWLYDNLSKYAGSYDDGREIISEVFADISTGKPCEFSRKFYKKLMEIIGGRGK